MLMTSSSSSLESTRNCAQQPFDHQYKGWLYKWTNYLKGYQKRWFMIHNGYLSYYRSVSCRYYV